MSREPIIHSHITDELPDDHPDARTSLMCRSCNRLIHAFNNECMMTWVETGKGNYCIGCFIGKCEDPHDLDDEWGLPD